MRDNKKKEISECHIRWLAVVTIEKFIVMSQKDDC